MPNYVLQQKALKLLGIDVTQWNQLNPQERKDKYHKDIIKLFREHHPDKHQGLDPSSQEYLLHEDITKGLTSLDYEQSIGEESNRSMPDPTVPKTKPKAKSRNFPKPQNGEEIVTNLMDYWRRDGSETAVAYYEQVKELVPNLVGYQQWHKVPHFATGEDFSWVSRQIATKMFLQHFKGSDTLVSALVSKDQKRIKDAFDLMIRSVKNPGVTRLFSSKESRVKQFVDVFCHFTPIDLETGAPQKKGGAIVGIDAETVLLICRSLELVLPYNIINPHEDLDQELIRESLTNYINNKIAPLALEANPTKQITAGPA